MKEQRIPLVGSVIRRGLDNANNYDDDQYFVNCFPEVVKNAITGTGKVFLNKRQGFSTFQIGPSGYVGGYAATSWMGAASNPGKVVFAFNKSATGDNAMMDYTGTQVGADIAGYVACISLTETMISGVSNLVAVMLPSGSSPVPDVWYYPEGGAWTQITDADFPSELGTPVRVVGEPVHLDGYMFIQGHNGRIYNSDLNSLSAWSALGYIDAQQSPDVGCGLVRYRNYIVALGPSSIEFFHNAGNATGSPLSRVQMISNVGCVPTYFGTAYQQYTPAITVGDTFYWLGMDIKSGNTNLYRMNGMTPQPVGTPSIVRMLAAFTNFKLWGTLSLHGMTHVMLSVHSQDGSYPAYCHDTGQWWFFKPAESDAITRFHSSSYIGSSYLTSASRNRYIGGVYPGSAVYQDNSTNFTMKCQFGNLDQGTTRKKFYHQAELICDKQTTAGNISISWSDDDYANFSTARTIDPSTGQRRITRLGSSQRNNNNKRAWKIEETVNRPFRGEALVVQYEVGNA